MTRREETLLALRRFKEEAGTRYGVVALGVFGSVSRGEAKADSDVDVVVALEVPDPFRLVHIKEELEQRLHCRVDLIRWRDRMNPRLKKRIEQEAVYV